MKYGRDRGRSLATLCSRSGRWCALPEGALTHCREADGAVREHRVDTPNAVDHLRDPQVDGEAREGQRLGPLDAVLATHEPEHRVDRDRSRLVEILVEAEREPRRGRPRHRGRELEVVSKRNGELGPLERALDRDLGDLAVSLGPMAVPRGEERAVDRYRQ